LREFKIIADGYEERSTHEMERLAWACANLMNCWSKKKIKPADLLPKGKFFKKENEKAKQPRLSAFEQKMISNKKDMGAFQTMMRGIQKDIKVEDDDGGESEVDGLGGESVDLSGYDESVDVSSALDLDSEV
jgi:hypothetical protein